MARPTHPRCGYGVTSDAEQCADPAPYAHHVAGERDMPICARHRDGVLAAVNDVAALVTMYGVTA